MEEIAHNFLQAFAVLRSNDSDAINNITPIIENMCSNLFSLAALTAIIQTNQEEYFRFQAVLTLKITIRKTWAERENKGELIQHFLQLVVREPNSLIRSNFIHVIAYAIDEGTLPIAVNFATFALQTADQVQIHSAILLLGELIGIINPSDQLTSFIDNLCISSTSFNNIEISIDAIQLAFDYHRPPYNILTESIQKIWSFSVSLIPQLINVPDKFWELSSILGDAYENECSFTNSEELFPVIFPYLLNLNKDVSPEIKTGIIYIIDSICYVDNKFILNANVLQQLFQQYVQISINEFNPEDEFNLQDIDVFSNICKSFSSFLPFIELVLNVIQQLVVNDAGKCISVLILKHCYRRGRKYLIDYLDDIVNILLVSLESPIVITRNATLTSIESFIMEFQIDAQCYVKSFEDVIIKLLKVSPSYELLENLTMLINFSMDSDEIYDELFPILLNLITNSNAESLIHIFPTFAVLNRWSNIGVREQFNVVLNILQSAITNPNLSFIKHMAIECLSTLAQCNPDQFASILPQYVQCLIEGMMSNDDTLICSCLNSFGTLLLFATKYMQPFIEQIIPIVNELCNRDKTLEIQMLAEEKDIKKNGVDQYDFDTQALETFQSSASLEVAGGAFLVFSSIIEQFPQYLANCIEEYYNKFRILTDSVITQSNEKACKGLMFVCNAIKTLDFKVPVIINNFVISLLKMIEGTNSDNVLELAITSLAKLIISVDLQTLGQSSIEMIINLLIAILQCNLLPLYDDDEEEEKFLSDEFYAPVNYLIFSLIEILDQQTLTVIFTNVIPEVLRYAKSNDINNQTFSLEILEKYCEKALNITPDFLQSILQLSLNVIQNNESIGFYCIKRFVTICPDLIKANLEQILQISSAKLTEKKRKVSSKILAMCDNCVTAIGAIAMNILQDQFPLQQYMHILLEKMPAQVDEAENPDMFVLFFWILEKGINEIVPDAIAVLARLFARSPQQLAETSLSPEVLQNLKIVLVKLLKQCQNGEEICRRALGNNKTKMRLLQEILSQ
ncbi:hypothetical protein GPJ56_003174 [Histomonas meleagridis]|uniref:uncharacterized protein n=1 Tax=Histomonas meleagridis TaxID=135588 RepID=UPI00355981F3|nr:hypothetical protein GPJ56_003174 [Histomonas meleagridis]KAH0801207.1 hypothetical protein GO595_005802 [Histomonas meleagridis]